MPDAGDFQETLNRARQALLAARTDEGHWEGELSSSALSTATAAFALTMTGAANANPAARAMAERGLQWLAAHQNADGGWGDTVRSFSNVSTTALCWAALGAVDATALRPQSGSPIGAALPQTRGMVSRGFPDQHVVSRCEAWLTAHAGGTDPDHLIPAIIARYGKDRTFSVPILTMCALAGRLGAGRDAWDRIPQLPFELAAFPQRWFKWLRLPVVSYALPALIAIGLVRHQTRPSRNPLPRIARRFARALALRLLEKIQPQSGGFLEATPLTSFVVMSLIGAGLADHPVVIRGIGFLIQSARADGSWPIDTNLSTWVTTLAVNALAADSDFEQFLPAPDRMRIREWLLGRQYRAEHPYTLADPGGWAWTHLSGGVPDADDTAGALLALKKLGPPDARTTDAASAGMNWLRGIQNRDGGVPTFCRGWGKLPFDRSSADLTAHALRAWTAWSPHPHQRGTGCQPVSRVADYPAPRQAWEKHFRWRRHLGFQPVNQGAVDGRRDRCGENEYRRSPRAGSPCHANALDYLIRVQRPDGAWAPLWFGNQHVADDQNPTYGTSRVLRIGLDDRFPDWNRAAARGVHWLLASQNPDGGWGGGANAPSSIEETALAIEALAGLSCCVHDGLGNPIFSLLRYAGGGLGRGRTANRSAPTLTLPRNTGGGDKTIPPQLSGTLSNVRDPVLRAVQWLIDQTDRGQRFEPSPIGFYFAKLWYDEKLYPLIFTVAALGAVKRNVVGEAEAGDRTGPMATAPASDTAPAGNRACGR